MTKPSSEMNTAQLYRYGKEITSPDCNFLHIWIFMAGFHDAGDYRAACMRLKSACAIGRLMIIRSCTVVGTGTAARALGPALLDAGLVIECVAGRDGDATARLARDWGAGRPV